MLHAAATSIGLWLVWLLLAQRWTSGLDLGFGVAVAVCCALLGARFGGVARGAVASTPSLALLALARAPAMLRGSVATVRAAIAADVSLKPALVLIKPRPASEEARAALATMMSLAPGAVVVEADDEGLLAHVLDEDAVDAVRVGALEAGVLAAMQEGRGV
jgi:multisubunit Na+/H+ antiporter MnhE subunit